MDVISEIRSAAKQRTLLNLTYRDGKGNVTSRSTEPYEIRDDSYFGFDVDKKAIRNFKIDQILSASATNTPYVPQWPVQIV